MKSHLLYRIAALFLTLSLSLPASASALREVGLEERSPEAKAELTRALTGLEEEVRVWNETREMLHQARSSFQSWLDQEKTTDPLEALRMLRGLAERQTQWIQMFGAAPFSRSGLDRCVDLLAPYARHNRPFPLDLARAVLRQLKRVWHDLLHYRITSQDHQHFRALLTRLMGRWERKGDGLLTIALRGEGVRRNAFRVRVFPRSRPGDPQAEISLKFYQPSDQLEKPWDGRPPRVEVSITIPAGIGGSARRSVFDEEFEQLEARLLKELSALEFETALERYITFEKGRQVLSASGMPDEQQQIVSRLAQRFQNDGIPEANGVLRQAVLLWREADKLAKSDIPEQRSEGQMILDGLGALFASLDQLVLKQGAGMTAVWSSPGSTWVAFRWPERNLYIEVRQPLDPPKLRLRISQNRGEQWAPLIDVRIERKRRDTHLHFAFAEPMRYLRMGHLHGVSRWIAEGEQGLSQFAHRFFETYVFATYTRFYLQTGLEEMEDQQILLRSP